MMLYICLAALAALYFMRPGRPRQFVLAGLLLLVLLSALFRLVT
jgi:hypothetical protein